MKEIKGSGTALITPFTDNYEIDYEAFHQLVVRQIEGGIDFLVPLGTTGETPTLDNYEKERILSITTEVNSGRLPVVAGASSNNTKDVITNIKLLSKYNPDAYLVVVPYYNKPTQQGIYEHFKAISESTSTSIILYNVPGRTVTNMTAETTLKVAQLKNVIATKEASANYAQISEIIRLSPEGFSVLSGNDDETFPLMCTGAKGVISVASNVAPRLVSELTSLLAQGKTAEAATLHHRLMPLFKGCFVESNPIPVKSALSQLGIIKNRLRLPLTTSLPQTDILMANLLKELEISK